MPRRLRLTSRQHPSQHHSYQRTNTNFNKSRNSFQQKHRRHINPRTQAHQHTHNMQRHKPWSPLRTRQDHTSKDKQPAPLLPHERQWLRPRSHTAMRQSKSTSLQPNNQPKSSSSIRPTLQLHTRIRLPPFTNNPSRHTRQSGPTRPPQKKHHPHQRKNLSRSRNRLRHKQRSRQHPMPYLSNQHRSQRHKTQRLHSRTQHSQSIQRRPHAFSSQPLPKTLPRLHLLRYKQPTSQQKSNFQPKNLRQFN